MADKIDLERLTAELQQSQAAVNTTAQEASTTHDLVLATVA